MATLVSRLHIIADEAQEAVSIALHDTANHVLELTKAYAPVKTGWLRDSYEKHTVDQLHVIVGSKVDYSFWQEYGTTRFKGRPHLTPAFKQAEPFFRSRLAARLKDLG